VSPKEAVVRVVDDDESIRRSLTGLLQSVGLRVTTYSSAQDFLAADLPDTPGCLVLDVHLPGLSGLELQKVLVDTDRALPIIFLTGLGDIPMTVSAMKAGAIEFLTKPLNAPALLEAIHHAIEQDRDARAERKSLSELRRRYDSLTPREREVMHRIIAGRLSKQIAAEFGTSETTVKEQRAQVMQKMQAETLIALALTAKRLGL
jgi:FixJ family two-component response regulator